MIYFGYHLENPTILQRAYMAAHDVAYQVWCYRDGPANYHGAYLETLYWLAQLNESLTGLSRQLLPAVGTPDPLDELDGFCGLTRTYWQIQASAGLCLQTTAAKVRRWRKTGLLQGCGGVYITHERNTRGNNVYHRIRLNICSQGRRVRRDLASYRIK